VSAGPPLTPARVELPATAAEDPRLGRLLGREVATAKVVLVGFPTDVGVRRNGGRPGAAGAPSEIRRFLYRMTPDPRAPAMASLLASTVDLGDVVTGEDLEADQERLGEVVGAALAAGAFPIVLGGGHETAYGHFLGYVRAGRAVTLLNWDAHADVRPLRPEGGHSGSPFRQALLHPSGLARGYAVAGLLPHSVAADHLSFIAEHQGRFLFRDALDPAAVRAAYRVHPGAGAATGAATGVATILASFDIDAVDQAQAPGVSAPATGGLTTALWLLAAREAGRNHAVSSADVVETNPALDRDGQTARLAALTVWSILRGLAERAGPG
jgi:formiminoglutamase